MTKGRLEAFTDGVVAIIITIMVLEMKVPPGDDIGAVQEQRSERPAPLSCSRGHFHPSQCSFDGPIHPQELPW
jgi:hypothetical protein